jgi:hypothetical protein
MDKVIRRLDSIHLKLLNTIAPLDDSVFSRCPSQNEWSVAEILQHLCLVEQRVVKDLERELKNPPRKIGFLRTLIPTSIVASRLVRVKAPKAVNPINPPPRNEIIANYNAARDRLKKLCSTHGRKLKLVIFKHPFLGDIDGTATVSFVGYHERRHHKQIREVIKKLNSADSAET